ncbi:insulinase family protein [Oribacterium sp. WCC10]|uniref:insulinase family protein n=1 Tax=Oribacterium sp. WCC10 TaxID=1855343 RepID=UPI0008EE92B3|nr:insulinase family protein [Oribacterium sp. WCC10]SFG38736.1 hypothetical protein SAMN05216356_10743 [Oribacterium sp. WCC10]
MKNYELIETKRIEELSTDACIYRHRKSGARIFTMKNDDDNKVFGIAFRTPAEDSTGVAHITEHSVLCGSEKFPLKDPFVELAKGSLNTFLNAMTYPDKTVYPIASRNDKDFDNLMNVYMDAVFHPNSVKDPRIMMQEGWHYEMQDEKDALIYNGVVYNEMKGVFSNPESVLERYIMHALFPDTTYGNESGGDPVDIPDLTFEDFKAFHARFYHPSNSYIFLYGDMDMEKKLDWLDKEYLSAYSAIEPNSDIAYQKPFDKMHTEEITYSVGDNEPLEKNTYLSWNAVVDAVDSKLNMAFDVLDYALLSSPGAPLKQALLDAGIGEDIFGGFQDGIRQPYFSVTAKGTDKKDKDKFLEVIDTTLKKIAREGLDKKTLLAAINHDEFQYREADYGRTPKGLVYSLTSLDTWLYGGKPWDYLECEKYYKELREDTEKGYFEALIGKYLLGNKHSALVICEPERGLTEKREKQLAKKLADIKKKMSKADIRKCIDDTRMLKEYQAEPTSEEDLKKLPLLSISDISKEAEKYSWKEERLADTLILNTELNTRGIAYIRFNFNTSTLTEEELQYAGFLKTVLGYMDTSNHTFQDLTSDILLNAGGINFDTNAYPDIDNYGHYTGVFSVEIKLLYDGFRFGYDIVDEILHTTRFEDKKRMQEILNESRSRERMRVEGASHSYAVNRATSYFSGTGRFADLTGGIAYYQFINRISEQFRKDPDALVRKLWEVSDKLFRAENMFVTIAAEKNGYEAFAKGFAAFKKRFSKETEAKKNRCLKLDKKYKPFEKAEAKVSPQILLSGNLNEGFKTPSQVNYVARTGLYDTKKLPYTGALRVLKVILNYQYLWLNLRVKGGAYGCMSGFGRSGEGYFASYRDPHLKETLDIYEALPEFVREFSTSERDMTKYIIGAVSELDTPRTNSAKAALTISAYMSNVTNEMLQKERDQVIASKEKDIRALAPYMEAILKKGAVCTIGNSQLIDENKKEFLTTEELFK